MSGIQGNPMTDQTNAAPELDSEQKSRGATADKLRIIVVYRADLPEMTRAKGEVQFGHAVAGVLVQTMALNPALVAQYMDDNQPKIAMEVADTGALIKIQEKAEKRGVPFFLVTDAAHTIFEIPTLTVLGLGPMTKTDGNNITRGAKMRE
jgi:peptidyl-tRNA hydrolase